MGLSIVYLENKEQIIWSERRTPLGEQEVTWQQHLEGARWEVELEIQLGV